MIAVAVDAVEVFASTLAVVVVEAELAEPEVAADAVEVGLTASEAANVAPAAVEVVPANNKGTRRGLGEMEGSQNRIAIRIQDRSDSASSHGRSTRW